jgi:hypothetical protein
MAQGVNSGFHLLDECVCEAIHALSIPLADRMNRGRNPGMSVIEELVFDAGKQSAGLNDTIKSEAERLAVFISATADPIGTASLFQKLLLNALAQMNGH